MRVLITNGYIVYYFNVVAFKTEIYDDIIEAQQAIFGTRDLPLLGDGHF